MLTRLAARRTRSYLPNTFNYSPGPHLPAATHPSRAAWIDSFRRTTGEFTKRAASDPAVSDAPAAAARFAARFTDELAALEDSPAEGAAATHTGAHSPARVTTLADAPFSRARLGAAP